MSKQLRVLVPVKRVIDYQVKPRLVNHAINTKGIKFSINPFDDIAVEEALRLKEKHAGLVEQVQSVSIGVAKAQDILRNCVAKGVDKATLVDSGDVELEPLAVAKVLKEVVEKDRANLVILGKQAIDDDSNNTGQMLAGLLGWPQATNVASVEVLDGGSRLRIVREVDGGEEVVEAAVPMVLTTDLRLNTPRYVSLQNLMKAKRKPIEKVSLSDFAGLDLANRLKVVKLDEPAPRAGGRILESLDELVTELKTRKVLK